MQYLVDHRSVPAFASAKIDTSMGQELGDAEHPGSGDQYDERPVYCTVYGQTQKSGMGRIGTMLVEVDNWRLQERIRHRMATQHQHERQQ